MEASPTDREPALRRLHEWLLSPTLETGSTRLQVGRASDGFWFIAEPAASQPLRRLVSREQALMVATSTLAQTRGGQIEVTEENGFAHVVLVPKGKRPWWQPTRSPLGSLLLGLLWLGLFIIRALDTKWPPAWSYENFALVVTGICAALYLGSTSFQIIRHWRARAAAEGPQSAAERLTAPR